MPGRWLFAAVVASLSLLFMAAPAHAGEPWLGVAIADDTDAVRVTQVVLETPADKAGLRKGDLVLAIDDTPTPTAELLIATVRRHRVGEEITVHVIRGDKKLSIRALLEPRAASEPDLKALARRQLTDRAAPPFDLPVVHGGGPGALAELEGQVVVLEFFATWCHVCPIAHEALATLLAAEGKRGLVVRGIAGDSRAELASYVKQHKLPFPVLHDAQKRAQADYMTQWLPTVVVIDRHGVVRYVGFGAGPNLHHAVALARALARDELAP